MTEEKALVRLRWLRPSRTDTVVGGNVPSEGVFRACICAYVTISYVSFMYLFML